jgi:hypothetical protein
MKKIYQIVSVIAAAAILSSCSVTNPVTASAAPIGNKVGTSNTLVLFGTLHLNKNYGVAEAARNGKIKGGVATVDVKTTNYLFFVKKELIVTGE